MDDHDMTETKIILDTIMDKITEFVTTLSEEDAQALLDGRASVTLARVTPEPPTHRE